MRKSRLSQRTEKRTKKTIILTTLGIVVILFLLIRFGTTVLIGFSILLAGKDSASPAVNNSSVNFVPAPVLNSLPVATNSAQVVITGQGESNETIKLYINNSLTDTASTDNNGKFSFSENLQTGSNQIEATALKNNKTSAYSDIVTVTYNNTPPTLTVNTPSDGQSFSKDQNTALVTGKTDPNVTVTVNGFWAVIDENNNFSYNLPLQNGDNQIKIIATDQAGNKTEKDIKVTYSQ